MSQLKIATAQMKALSADVDRRFAVRMVEHLVKVLPPPDSPDPEAAPPPSSADTRLRPLIRQAMDYASEHGFVHEDEVALVVVLLVAARQDAAVQALLDPWAAEVLERDDSSALTRLVWIEHQVAERAGKEAAARQLQTALQVTREAFG